MKYQNSLAKEKKSNYWTSLTFVMYFLIKILKYYLK